MYYERGLIGSLLHDSNRRSAPGRHNEQCFHEKPLKLLEDKR